MVTHTVSCYRDSTLCKACGERLKKTMKLEHLALWKNKERIEDCIARDDEEEFTLVLEHGIQLEHRITPNGKTLLHLCAIANAIDCLLLLISRGADTDPVDEKGSTPLMLALEKGSKKVAINLIELGAEIECKYSLINYIGINLVKPH